MLTGIQLKKNENKEPESKEQADSFVTIEGIEERKRRRDSLKHHQNKRENCHRKTVKLCDDGKKEFIDPRDQINLRRPIGKMIFCRSPIYKRS